ncbi:ABC transporter substrate-binding protein [Aliirhizobium terrae]|uniref:ABC transporter substrate-binding protein n=1 Tax=Terrirhizobium terrae TaxID=2926709 RepID=UPI00336A718A
MANDLKVAVQAVPASIDPASENSNVSLRVIYSVYDTLVKADFRDGGKLKPALATSWNVIDAKTVEFKLRPDVRFHNGETLSADDIAATFSPARIGLDPNIPVEIKSVSWRHRSRRNHRSAHRSYSYEEGRRDRPAAFRQFPFADHFRCRPQ